jgi:hypothetical protein
MANGSRAGQPLPFQLPVRLSVSAHQWSAWPILSSGAYWTRFSAESHMSVITVTSVWQIPDNIKLKREH